MDDFVTDVNLNLIVGGTSNRLAWGEVIFFGKVKVNISITRSNSGESFVSWPGYYSEKDGNKKWINSVRFNEIDDYKLANESILQAFNQLLEGDTLEPPPPEVIEPKQSVVSVTKKANVWAKKK